MHFHIGVIKANGIEQSSALNIGTNILIGFASSSKSINGNGSMRGDHCLMPAGSCAVDDRDYVDAPSFG